MGSKNKNNYKVRATIQVTGVSKPDSEHFLRGIHSGRDICSLTINIGQIPEFFISSHSQGSTREKAKSNALTISELYQSLLPGCKFDDDDLKLEVKKHSVILYVLGLPHIGYNAQTNELINALMSVGINATIVLNIFPLDMEETEIAHSQPMKEARNRLLIDDCAFLVTYAIFLTNDNQEALKTNLNTIIGVLGSIYDTEHSQLEVTAEFDKKAVKTLQKLLWGDFSYSSILTTRELVPYTQLPALYGIEKIIRPEMYVPPPSVFRGRIEFGNVLGNFDEKLHKAFFNPNTTSPHIAMWGETGCGKSTLAKHLIVGLYNHSNFASIIFDHHNEYRYIIPLLNGELGKDILIFNPYITPFTINPLEIPSNLTGQEKEIAKIETVENIVYTFKHQLDWTVGENQEQRFRKHSYSLYEKTSCPTFSQVIKRLEGDMRTLTQKDLDNLPLKMSKFTSGPYGELFDKPHTNLPFEAMENAITIFELGRWPVELRSFFIVVFLNQLWNRRITRSVY